MRTYGSDVPKISFLARLKPRSTCMTRVRSMSSHTIAGFDAPDEPGSAEVSTVPNEFAPLFGLVGVEFPTAAPAKIGASTPRGQT